MTYAEQHATLVAYLKMKTGQADWHAVSDAANDLRVLECYSAASSSAPSGSPHSSVSLGGIMALSSGGPIIPPGIA